MSLKKDTLFSLCKWLIYLVIASPITKLKGFDTEEDIFVSLFSLFLVVSWIDIAIAFYPLKKYRSRIKPRIRLKSRISFWIFPLSLICLLTYYVSNSIFLAIGLTCASFIGSIYWLYPIKVDRWLYGNHSYLLILGVIGTIISIVLVWVGIIDIWGPESTSILGNDGTPENSKFWAILSQFADPGNIPQSSGKGKSIAFITALLGIVCLSGFFVSSIVNFLSKRSDNWRKGLIIYKGVRRFNNYVVIIGVNEQISSIVRQTLNQDGIDYVLIQTRKDVEKARMALELKMEDELEDRIVFYAGERTSAEDVAKLHLEKAIEVYILGEDMRFENEEDHDAFNMSCLEHVSQYMSKREVKKHREKNFEESNRRLRCHVDLEYQSTYTIFKSTHIYRDIDAKDIEFLPFNVHEIWAKKVLIKNHAIIQKDANEPLKVQKYLPLDAYWEVVSGKRVIKYVDSESDKSIHLFILGMNQMGTAMAIQAALLCHLPNFTKKGLRTTITFVDDNAIKEAEFFMGRFKVMFELSRYKIVDIKEDQIRKPYIDPISDSRFSHLGENFIDIQWEFIQGNVASPEIMKYMGNCCKSKKETCTIAVCFNNPQQSIATAMYLNEDILREALQVLVYQQNSFDMIEKVSHGEKQWKRYEKLRPFGMIENSYEGSVFDNLLAKLIYYKFSAKDEAKTAIENETVEVNSKLLSEINRLWNELGIVDKLSNIDLADSLELKLRSAGTSVDANKQEQKLCMCSDEIQFGLFAFTEHNRWVTERLTMGYRPLNQKEWEKFFATIENRRTLKDLYKSKSRAHVDICSNVDLDNKVEVEKKHSNDESFLKSLPLLLELKEKIIVYQRSINDIVDEFVRDMVFVEGGSIIVDKDETSKKERKKLECISFNIAKHPVSQDLWEKVMGTNNNPSFNKSSKRKPVESVSLHEVNDFLLVLREKTGLRFSIPSLDEWEFAARGGLKSKKFKYSGGNNLADVAWSQVNGTQEIGEKHKPNELGLYDMCGNVWEWTQSENDSSTFYFCGGSWKFTGHWCNLYECYSYWTPDFKSQDIGVRLTMPADYVINKETKHQSEPTTDDIIDLLREHFVDIQGGRFMMGLPDNKELTYNHKKLDVSAEQPQHEVEITTFKMGITPVTQRIWKAVMGKDKNKSLHKGDDYPVENVSFLDVQEFIEKLNSNYELKKHLKMTNDVEFRLPTEAEWEFAARGGNTDVDILFAGSDNADDVAWHNGLTKTTQPVRLKKKNKYGLYDMCGNVWEWCNDWYLRSYYHHCKARGLVQNPGGPQGPRSTRVFRGGSWRFSADECRVTRPGFWIEDYAAPDLGFRLVIGHKVEYDNIKIES